MGLYESSRSFPFVIQDLSIVVKDLSRHFELQDYEVKTIPSLTRGYDISLYKGGTFREICGTKTALKIEIYPEGLTTFAKASIGFFGLLTIPNLIATFFFTPMILGWLWTQVVKQQKLDEEALGVIAASLESHRSGRTPDSGDDEGISREKTTKFCSACGIPLEGNPKFCHACGIAVGSTL